MGLAIQAERATGAGPLHVQLIQHRMRVSCVCFCTMPRPFLSAGVWRARAAYVQRDVRRGDSVCAGALRARCQMCYQNFFTTSGSGPDWHLRGTRSGRGSPRAQGPAPAQDSDVPPHRNEYDIGAFLFAQQTLIPQPQDIFLRGRLHV